MNHDQLSYQFIYGHKNYQTYKFPGSDFIVTGFIDGKVKLEVHIGERERNFDNTPESFLIGNKSKHFDAEGCCPLRMLLAS